MPADFPIHVVICTFGRATLLRRTLASLAEVRRPASFAQAWVIENGTNDGAEQICAEIEESTDLPLRYVHRPQKGKSRALQFALDEIGRGLVVFTDDDVRFDAGWLEAFAQAAAEHGENAFFGGPLLIDYEVGPPPQWLHPQLPCSALGWSLPDDHAPITKACFLGANYGGFVQRFQSVGGYKAHLGIGSRGNPVGEEFEIQDRLLADGARGVYLPDAKLWHWVPAERSSPRWTLERAERVWFTDALMGKTHHADGPRLAGVPRWMWRRLIARWLRKTLAALSPDAQKRHQQRMLYHQWRGTVRGLRQRHRHPEYTAEAQPHG